MAIIDIISFNGEYDLFEIRYNMLKDIVDEFRIVEAPTTFSGQPKPIYALEAKKVFYDNLDKWPKVKLYIVDENYTPEEIEAARTSPYTGGVERWMREYLHKEALTEAMDDLEDDDICYVGDVDELWEHREPSGIEKLKLRVYAYYLNFRSTEEFWGPIRARYKDIKGQCLNNVRNNAAYRTEDYQGWHFTNQGGIDVLKKKVVDQYNDEAFNGHLIKSGIDQNFGIRDFIGRNFNFETDESELPQYLKDNKQKYSHLWKS